MMNERSLVEAAAAGFGEGLGREAEAIILQDVRKQTVNLKPESPRNGKPSPAATLRKGHVFYSLDGDEVMAYNVEVHTDNTGTNTSIKTKESHSAQSRHVPAPGSSGSRNSDTVLPSRFIYSESLREDILEHFDLVAYQESKSDVFSTEDTKIRRSKQTAGSGPVVDSISRGEQVQNVDHSSPEKLKSSAPHPILTAFLRKGSRNDPMNNRPKDLDAASSAYSLFCEPGTGIWCSPSSQSTLPTKNASHAVAHGPETLHSQNSCQKVTNGEGNDDNVEGTPKNGHSRRFPEVVSSIIAQRRQALTSLLLTTHERGAKLVDRFSQDVYAANRLWHCEDDNDEDEYEILSDDEGALTCGTPTTGSTALDSSREPVNAYNCMGFSLRKNTS